MSEHQADVVVLGFGCAGASAAIAAHDAGASVLIVEKMPEAFAGGSSRVSGNVWFDPRDPAAVLRYLEELCGDRKLPPPLMERWSNEVVRNTEWVQSLGVETSFMAMPYEFPDLPSHECDPGYNFVMPTWGMGRLYEALKSAVAARQIEVLYDTRAERLTTDAEGHVVGLSASGNGRSFDIAARCGIVLATGGFTNSPELARTYLRLPSICPWGSPAATGDGFRMAQKVGAGLSNMENFMGMMGIAAPEHASGFNVYPFPAHGWIVVDHGARRFVDETARNGHGKIAVGHQYKLYPDRPCFAIFDERTRLSGALVPSIETQWHGWNQRIEDYRWSADNSAEIAKGWIVRADTPEELGEALGIPAAQLAMTISSYNDSCARGRDEAFGRDAETLQPIDRGPYYAFPWGNLLVFTNGGPSKDENARVLDSFGEPIIGLYAAGEVASTYSHCMSGGFMIADALAFGRVAGRSAAANRVV